MTNTAALSKPPLVAVFDVNETLSDMTGLAGRLEEVGAGAALLPAWFAATLRDGFALTAAGAYADFSAVAVPTLAAMLAGVETLRGTARTAAEHVVAGMAELDLHPDVAPGLRTLADAGVRIVTLSNGAAAVAESLLERAGLRDLVEGCLSISDAGRWKPAAEAYAYAARRCTADPGQLVLIAVHPWDIDGARRAGLRTGWLSRDGRAYPSFFLTPEAIGHDLPALAAELIDGGRDAEQTRP
ncbi:MAG: haloacid dehalogenase type II [Actinomycetota bacterium]|nr:haloacid dehalogenase type II [Actinomycetota bacterium]